MVLQSKGAKWRESVFFFPALKRPDVIIRVSLGRACGLGEVGILSSVMEEKIRNQTTTTTSSSVPIYMRHFPPDSLDSKGGRENTNGKERFSASNEQGIRYQYGP